MSFRSDSDLKQAYVERLRQEGRGVAVDVPVDSTGGTIDILTEREIIFCSLVLDEKSAIALKSQLDFYSRFARSREKVAVVHKINSAEAANQLTEAGIKLVTLSPLNTVQSAHRAKPKKSISLAPASHPTSHKSIVQTSRYRYPALNSVQGGEGLYVAVVSFFIVILVGLVGLIAS